jgi:hypothetical protein
MAPSPNTAKPKDRLTPELVEDAYPGVEIELRLRFYAERRYAWRRSWHLEISASAATTKTCTLPAASTTSTKYAGAEEDSGRPPY